MSGLTNMTKGRQYVHRQLLATVSAAALLGFVSATDTHAADADKPMIWIDLGGQVNQLSDRQSRWTPDYFSSPDASPLDGTFQAFQKTPRYGYDAYAGISFQPKNSDWIVSASLRVGRARQPEEASKSAAILPSFFHYSHHSHYGVIVHNNESHLFVDFSAGKDVGLGIAGVESTFSAGVRFANLRSRSDVQISSNFPQSLYGSATNEPDTRISREFRGWGPKIAWDGSVPIVGTPQGGQLGVEWGVNAALLFGRQTTKQKTDAFYRERYYDWTNRVYVSHAHTAHSTNVRRKNMSVPALGGYLAASYRLPNAKVSLGYRADWYFNALDGGVATSQKVDRGFFGPYASVSIGIGD